ncbi:MAG: hypothetical protein CSA96_01020 [Bacteroidetes bacterium]|nr:MAG: hypothetical protein CSA96_01020 [Bacteroidota bacterium]
MAYTKRHLEIHSAIAELHKHYGDRDFIQFDTVPEPRGIEYLEPIARAIEEQKVLRLYYLPFYEDKPYFNELHPYILKEYQFRWYLVAWNAFREQLRTYALDRIRDLQESPELEYRAPDFDAAGYFRYAMGIIAPEGAPELIKMRVQKTQAQYLITMPWHPSQNIAEEGEDFVVFSFRLHPTYEFKSKVLSLGKDAEILGPLNLREKLAVELRMMAAGYEDQRLSS